MLFFGDAECCRYQPTDQCASLPIDLVPLVAGSTSGTRPADRRQTGGRGLAQTSLVLPTCVVLQEDLDRAACCDRTPRVPDRACSGLGVRAGRRPGRRRVAGRVRARCRLGDDHADRHHRGEPFIDDPARLRVDRDPGGRDLVLARHRTAPYEVCYRHRRPDAGSAGAAVRRGRRPVRCVLAGWLHKRDDAWTAVIATASLDPFRGYATALHQQLPHTVRVLDPSMSRRSGRPRSIRCAAACSARLPASGSSWRPALRDPPHPASPRRPALRAGLGSAAGRTRRWRPVRGGHRRLDHRPGPDALLPAPRRQRRGSGHHRRPRLPSSRNRPSRKDIAHMAGGVPRALRPHRRLQRADRILEPEDQEHQAHQAVQRIWFVEPSREIYTRAVILNSSATLKQISTQSAEDESGAHPFG